MGLFIIAVNLLTPFVGTMATLILATNTDNVLIGFSSIFLITTVIYFFAVFILAFMHYESQLESEYQLYYRRYLLFKGYVSGKSRSAALKVSSSFRIKKRR